MIDAETRDDEEEEAEEAEVTLRAGRGVLAVRLLAALLWLLLRFEVLWYIRLRVLGGSREV